MLPSDGEESFGHPAAESTRVETSFVEPPTPPLPAPHEESTLEDPLPMEVDPDDDDRPVSYQIVEEGSQRRKKRLVEACCWYTYNVKEKGKTTVYWQCTVRHKDKVCRATVKETDGGFVLGAQGHNHP